MIHRTGTLTVGALVAGLSAGPLFLTCTTLAMLYGMIPHPIIIDPAAVPVFLIMLVPATIVGAIIGIPTCALGGWLMRSLGDHLPAARLPISWLAIGGAIGAGVSLLIALDGVPAEPCFGLIAASAASAGLCRRHVGWQMD